MYPECPSVLSDLSEEVLAPPKRRAKSKASSLSHTQPLKLPLSDHRPGDHGSSGPGGMDRLPVTSQAWVPALWLWEAISRWPERPTYRVQPSRAASPQPREGRPV